MYFPVADIEISPAIPLSVGLAISLFTSMGGVSGAFLLLPFQISVLGFYSPAVSATNHLFNIVAIPSGVWRYSREGRMIWPLTSVIVIGTLPGVLIGASIRVHFLSDSQDFKLFVGVVLLYLGGKLAMELRRKENDNQGQTIAEEQFQRIIDSQDERPGPGELPKVSIRRFNARRLVYEFCGEKFDLSVPRLMFVSLAVGAVGGSMGLAAARSSRLSLSRFSEYLFISPRVRR